MDRITVLNLYQHLEGRRVHSVPKDARSRLIDPRASWLWLPHHSYGVGSTKMQNLTAKPSLEVAPTTLATF